MGKRIAAVVGRLIIGACVVTLLCNGLRAEVVFCCRADNDLFKLMPSSPRFDSPPSASITPPTARRADPRRRLPETRTDVPDDLFARAPGEEAATLRRIPSLAPGLKLGETRTAVWERGVITSDAFGDNCPDSASSPRTIAAGSRSIPSPQSRLIDISRVAGFDTAVFGLGKDHAPLLFETATGISSRRRS
jgi:hypothetical protein